jgi:Mn-dependent DtxR family transcriptional regulator
MNDHRFRCPQCEHLLLPEAIQSNGITRREKDALAFIIQYKVRHRIAPLYDEIAQALGVKRRSQVKKMLQGLEAAGFITSSRLRRSIQVTEAGAGFHNMTIGGAHA